jgi:outer membrane protein
MVARATRAATRRRAAPLLRFLVAALAAGVPMAAQAQEPVGMTLDEVIQRALQHSPQLAQAEGNLQMAATAERTAIGAFLPNLNLSSGASVASTQRFDPNAGHTVSGSSDSYSAGILSSIDLFTGGRRGADLARPAPRPMRRRPPSSSSGTS